MIEDCANKVGLEQDGHQWSTKGIRGYGIVIDWISQPYLDDVGKRYHAGAMITLQNAPYYKLDRSYQPDPV